MHTTYYNINGVMMSSTSTTTINNNLANATQAAGNRSTVASSSVGALPHQGTYPI